jgi:Spy/CpxP family protein refolding chaperone
MKRTFVISLALLLIVGTVAFAQGRAPHQGGPGGPGGAPRIPGIGGDANGVAEYLGLTAEQQASWETIQSELRTSVQAQHEQQRTLAEQLATALEGTDATAIGTLMLQIKGIQTQLDAAKDAAEAKFAATLTAEQKAKFEALMAAADYLRQRGPGGPH